MGDRMTDAEVRAFLMSDPPHTGKLATVRKDGSPHVAPVWYVLDDDGDHPLQHRGRDAQGADAAARPALLVVRRRRAAAVLVRDRVGHGRADRRPRRGAPLGRDHRRPLHGRGSGRRVRRAQRRPRRAPRPPPPRATVSEKDLASERAPPQDASRRVERERRRERARSADARSDSGRKTGPARPGAGAPGPSSWEQGDALTRSSPPAPKRMTEISRPPGIRTAPVEGLRDSWSSSGPPSDLTSSSGSVVGSPLGARLSAVPRSRPATRCSRPPANG